VNAARRAAALGAAALCGVLASAGAEAVALYNRQTGQSCAACHTAPPELTPFGRRFMLNGFTMSGGKRGIPLSGFVEAGLTSTAKDASPTRPGLRSNDNADVQRLKAITGGAITNSIGAFAELVYSPIDERLKLGNVDVRYADSFGVGRHDVVAGVSLHNNPGFQDPWNSTLARTWPYARSAAQPPPRTAALLDGPLAQRALGASAYGFVDDAWYVELGGYRGLRRGTQDALGTEPGDTRTIQGTALYARLAHESRVMPGTTLTVGASLLDAELSLPGGGTPTDSVLNVGLDALLQWARGPHEATVRATANRERWSVGSSVAQGFAARDRNRLDNLKLSASYLNAKRYSATAGVFRRSGSRDVLFFGTPRGRPDTAGWQLDGFIINPLFPPPAWHPGMRTRIGLSHTHFTRFDGLKSDVDGTGRNASANDTTFLYFLWAL
jgi:hypothetical protein